MCSHVVTVQQIFKLPTGLMFGNLDTGKLWSHYGVMLVELSCLRQTTKLHCPLKAYKAVGTPMQLYSHVVTAQQPFKLPTRLIFGHLATGGVVEPLWCDPCRVVMP